MTKDEKPLAEHVDALPKLFNTPEIRYELPDEIKFEVVRRVVEHYKATAEKEGHQVVDVDGARVTWKDGWALVRASNTQPALVLALRGGDASRASPRFARRSKARSRSSRRRRRRARDGERGRGAR